MGKGFNNYMCKKFFHPASRDNLKRVWMAEQQAEAYKKKQEELRVQYEKEQDLHNNKALLSKESKDKLSVNFMYEPPPGAKKEREKEDNEPEYKFEWQRKYNAPRESYCKGDSEIRDQPFGIQVRNVRCIKCHKWGHINTDKECPLYSQAISVVMANNGEITQAAPDAMTLVQQMREDGLGLKKSALNAQQHLQLPQHNDLLMSDDENQDVSFLKSLTKKEKKKLLKKLRKMEKKHKKLKKKKRHDLKSDNSSSSSDTVSNHSNSDDEHNNKKMKKKKSNKEYDSEDEKNKKYKSEKYKVKDQKYNLDRNQEKEDRYRTDRNKEYRNKNDRIKEYKNKEDKYKEDKMKKKRKDRSKEDRNYVKRSRDEYRTESRKRKNSDSETDTRSYRRDDKRMRSR